MDAAKLPKALRRYAPIIADMDRDSDGWMFGLIVGFVCLKSETHQIMERSISDCVRAFGEVVVCRCGDQCCEAWQKRGTSPEGVETPFAFAVSPVQANKARKGVNDFLRKVKQHHV